MNRIIKIPKESDSARKKARENISDEEPSGGEKRNQVNAEKALEIEVLHLILETTKPWTPRGSDIKVKEKSNQATRIVAKALE